MKIISKAKKAIHKPEQTGFPTQVRNKVMTIREVNEIQTIKQDEQNEELVFLKLSQKLELVKEEKEDTNKSINEKRNIVTETIEVS